MGKYRRELYRDAVDIVESRVGKKIANG